MTEYQALLAAAVTVLFYAVLCNRVTRLVHSIRMQMAEKGEELLNTERLPAHMVTHIEVSMDNAYCTFCAWVAVFAVPIAAVAVIFDEFKGRPDPFSDVPVDLRADVDQFAFLSFVSTFANSPLAAILFAMQFGVLLVLWIPAGRLARELFSLRDGISNVAHSGKLPWHHNHA